tara:strand:+ start:44790 stop:45887 length:1098 start_codon:yes stop_codon:yes gene_type:complete
MDWESVLITAALGSIFVCLLILFINQSGKRGQAITWLPAALATTLAVTYTTNEQALSVLLETAFASILISGVFIISFSGILGYLLPGTEKTHDKCCGTSCVNITDGTKTIIFISTIFFALIVPMFIVWLLEKYENPFWSLVAGFAGIGITTIEVMSHKRLEFEPGAISFSISNCCKGTTPDEKARRNKEIWMLLGAVIGTFTFVILPAYLADCSPDFPCAANWAGIVANAPKISVLIMISLWVTRDENIGPEAEDVLRTELQEHLTMFSYSTGITAIYILIVWWNQVQVKPEDFWWAWGTGFVLSLGFIAGILIPVCLGGSQPEESVGQRQKRNVGGGTAVTVLAPKGGPATQLVNFQGYPKVKF